MLLLIEMDSAKPLYQQIRDQIVRGIASGQLQAGSNLPPIRQLAADFGINLHTVNKAYELLQQEGLIELKPKIGAVIKIQPTLPEAWDDNLSNLLAEAVAHQIPSADIMERCRTLLAELVKQRAYGTHVFEKDE
ncbi:GntR family transcriptional regulator [Tengunoibacter tsumagoiensis]|uniref:GntR family transcriptional regulator n=1 Tax=Tengunoibacter tsumagoiensis TaxID=2014871 RepID=A0A401ZXH3_9CHLR|nr:GntR family transcriptional regulator [Tengunoibacter tsumagoiensis]GCE11537.1 GntR family transcriptional regulator [Tengunoibacter tsumagoiensis]